MARLSRLSRSIEGRVALVTGAASGMGRATAHLFSDEGARVAVVDRQAEGVDRVVDEIRNAGGEAQGFVADLLFLRANMYFVSHLFSDRIFPWLDLYVDTILALDPDNPTVYEWASQSVKNLPTNQKAEKKQALKTAKIEKIRPGEMA